MINISATRLPRLSLRFFIYLLFGLVILVLVGEGGYYFWLKSKVPKFQGTTKSPSDVLKYGPDGEVADLIGQVTAIEDRVLTIGSRRDPRSNQSYRVKISENARFATPGEEKLMELSSDAFDQISIGSVVVITNPKKINDELFLGEIVQVLRAPR